ncbi:MAG: TIM barrel protein [Planctomycetes bacterium]|nr:TIM barrel protein [Planctomycetota bacterium]
MSKFSVCIETIFKEVDFVDRISKAKEAGADAFEFWGYDNKDVDAVNKARKDADLPLAAMSAAGGIPLVDAANKEKYVEAMKAGLEVAKKLECATVLQTVGQEIEGVPRETQHAAIVECLRAVAPLLADAGVTLVLEPLNILVNHKGYYLDKSSEGFDILREVDHPNMKLLYDIYHQQITEGNLIDTITANIDLIGHFHMADVPGRHEPGTGELNYANIFKAIDETAYDKYVGIAHRRFDAGREGHDCAGVIGVRGLEWGSIDCNV